MRKVYDPQRFKEYFEGAFTYEAGFRRNIRRYGNDSAILDPETGRNWTYAELDADVARTASALAQLPGIRDPLPRDPAHRRGERTDQLPALRGRDLPHSG